MKYFISLLFLISFIGVAVFGFALMTHWSDGRMSVDCPLSTMGKSLCTQIFTYNTFFNTLINVNIIIFAISIPTFVFFVFLISIYSSFLYSSPFVSSYNRKITRWLSLFENSPSYL
ncbi:MAG: hypothetical protein NUV47_00305 [Patescibacteria group bacterium]|nr:hypothetical protein [Patescibacteria group bacterium]